MAALVLSYTLDPVHEAKAPPPSVITPQVATNAGAIQQAAKSVVASQVAVAQVAEATTFPSAHCVKPPVEPPCTSKIVLHAAAAAGHETAEFSAKTPVAPQVYVVVAAAFPEPAL